MTYLVTGGTGLIGSRIVRDLVREGERVVVYDWLPNRSALAGALSEQEIDDKVTIVPGDVTDAPGLIRTIKENNVEKIIHTASLLVLDSNSNPLRALKINSEGTICVFEAARILGLKKVVWSSSNSVFGPPEMYPEEYIPNNAPQHPQNIYAATKSFNETVAAYYVNQYDLDITGIRYMHVYGGETRRGFIATIIQQLVLNPALGKPGRVPHSDAIIGWSYVDDPARASVMASKVTRPKTRSYSIMGDVHSVREVADYVQQVLPDADLTLLPGGFTGDPVKLDTSHIEEEIGYRPDWSMERGIKETINMVRKQNGMPPV